MNYFLPRVFALVLTTLAFPPLDAESFSATSGLNRLSIDVIKLAGLGGTYVGILPLKSTRYARSSPFEFVATIVSRPFIVLPMISIEVYESQRAGTPISRTEELSTCKVVRH